MGIFSRIFKSYTDPVDKLLKQMGITPENTLAAMQISKGVLTLIDRQQGAGGAMLAIAVFPNTPGAHLLGQWQVDAADGMIEIQLPPLPGEVDKLYFRAAPTDFVVADLARLKRAGTRLPPGIDSVASKKTKHPDPLEEGLRLLRKLVEDEDYQNSLLEPPIAEAITSGEALDEIAGAQGAFGFSAKNPIPVNGRLGELSYLSRLRNERGERLFFHRVGSIDLIDIYEAVSWSGKDWYVLYFDIYHPRRSRKPPQGFSISTELGQFTGFYVACSEFPMDFIVQKRECPFSLGYISIETATEALEAGTFVRPDKHKAALGAWAATVGTSLADGVPKTSSTGDKRQSQLKLLIAHGKEQGYLTYAEVNDHLPSEIVDPEQIEDIVNMINDMGIRVYEHAPAGAGPEPEATVTSKKVDESIWAAALWEYETTERRPGLYARLFAELDGDEAKTKAAYIKERFNQLKSERRS